MVILIASPETYFRVVRHRLHAFDSYPRQIADHETVLLAQADAPSPHRGPYIRHVARVSRIRDLTAFDAERLFPGVGAGNRWWYAVELTALAPLRKPLYLYDVVTHPRISYHNAQKHTKLRAGDDRQVLAWLAANDPQLVCDLLNAERHDQAA